MNPNSEQRPCCFAIFRFRFETRVFVVVFFVVAFFVVAARSALAPIAGPGQMYLEDPGYVTEEFRMLVRHSKNPKRFSGIVVAG